MSKNPLVNALAASAYIFVVALVMTFGLRTMNKPDTFMAPVAALSMFTLSAAVMAYIFCLIPLELFLEGKKKLGVRLFLQSVGIFGLITAVILAGLSSGIF